MLCDRFVSQARDDIMSQIKHIEPVYIITLMVHNPWVTQKTHDIKR